MRDVYPEVFKVEYVFFGGGANKVELDDHKLVLKSETGVIRSDRMISKKELKPSEDEWTQFWRKTDEIDAWNWDREYTYVPEGLKVDGDIFKVSINFENKNIDTFSWVKQTEGSQEFFNALKDLIKLDIKDPEVLK